jgi:uncharacterized protein
MQSRLPKQPGGLLAVIDVRNDPLQVFDAVATLGIENIDFLLPHYHWDRPPPRPSGRPEEYGAWLYAIFDAWVGGRHPQVEIRFFRNIILQFLGIESNFEVMNLSPVRLVTVNTDGDIEGVDTLKSTATSTQCTGLNIHNHSFDAALQVHLVAFRQAGVSQLCHTCRDCKYMKECAGGYFPHRYSHASQFDNPSIYCQDLYWLLDRIGDRLCQARRPHSPHASESVAPI